MNTIHKARISSLSRISSMAVCGIALILQGCEFNMDIGVKGSGVQTTKSFELDSFDQVRFSGSGTYNIKCGEEQSVAVSFDDNLMEFVELTVENGQLKLNVTESYSSSDGLIVDITVPELKNVKVSGAGTAKITNYQGEKLAIDVSGAATIIAEGSVDTVEVEAAGACGLKLTDLVAKNCTVDMSGAGSARVHATETLNAKLSGVGSVKYKGDPTVEENISGIGSVSKID